MKVGEVRGIRRTGVCPACGAELGDEDSKGTRVQGVEYAYESSERYDGVSEWVCPECGYREGRWTGAELRDGYVEPRHGRGGVPVRARVRS